MVFYKYDAQNKKALGTRKISYDHLYPSDQMVVLAWSGLATVERQNHATNKTGYGH